MDKLLLMAFSMISAIVIITVAVKKLRVNCLP